VRGSCNPVYIGRPGGLPILKLPALAIAEKPLTLSGLTPHTAGGRFQLRPTERSS